MWISYVLIWKHYLNSFFIHSTSPSLRKSRLSCQDLNFTALPFTLRTFTAYFVEAVRQSMVAAQKTLQGRDVFISLKFITELKAIWGRLARLFCCMTVFSYLRWFFLTNWNKMVGCLLHFWKRLKNQEDCFCLRLLVEPALPPHGLIFTLQLCERIDDWHLIFHYTTKIQRL